MKSDPFDGFVPLDSGVEDWRRVVEVFENRAELSQGTDLMDDATNSDDPSIVDIDRLT